MQNDAKAFRQLKLKAHYLIGDPQSGFNKEFIKALYYANKGIIEYEKQVGLALINQQMSSNEATPLTRAPTTARSPRPINTITTA